MWGVYLRAYFNTAGVSADTLSQLIKTALAKCEDSGLKVTSITTDGLKTNFTAVNKLGCRLYCSSLQDICTSFPHPVTGHPVAYVPDAVHMLKLARNCLGTYDLTSPTGVHHSSTSVRFTRFLFFHSITFNLFWFFISYFIFDFFILFYFILFD
jgi:hypothetical protein